MARLNTRSSLLQQFAPRAGDSTALDFARSLGDSGTLAVAFLTSPEGERFASLSIGWNSRLTTTAGRCMSLRSMAGEWQAHRLELNPKLSEEGPAALANTFLHELAHAIAGHAAGHGAAWKRAHRALGGTAERCHTFAAMAPKRRARRVVARCEGCGFEVKRARALPRGRQYTHSGCGGRFLKLP